MPSRNPKYHSSELIKGILREIQQILDNKPQRGWMSKLAEKHGIPSGTIGGWWKRYRSPDQVPERAENSPTVVTSRPKGSATKPANSKRVNGKDGDQFKSSDLILVQANSDLLMETQELKNEIVKLKLIIADAYIESVRRSQ